MSHPDARTSHSAKVFLIGAGPGDPELITVRGRRALGSADLVLHDALIDEALLAHCAPTAEVRFVGKRAGQPSLTQPEINAQICEAAQAGRVVARLKGGDPLTFGRGSEEAEALVAAGIPFEIVPGVPSPMGAAAFAGVPLTHRDLSTSVTFLTATEGPGRSRSRDDWTRLANATDTLVVFMGQRHLQSLMETLIEAGRDPETPACVVQSASSPSQRVVTGTLRTLPARVAEAALGTPALTIIGHVVSLRPSLDWFERLPLFGKRVLVTRPAEQAGPFLRALRDAGAEPIAWPAIRIAPPEDPGPLEEAVRDAASYDWIVFTSANGVRAFFAELARQGGDARRLGPCHIATIGPKTAGALKEHGLHADLTPDEFRGEAVAEVLLGQIRDRAQTSVLIPRAAVAREVLPERLREAGLRVSVVTAYRSLPPEQATVDAVRERFLAGAIEVVTVTSPSTVQNLVEALGDAAAALDRVCIASIGPITTERAEELGLRVSVTASDYTSEGLLEALQAHYRPGTRSR